MLLNAQRGRHLLHGGFVLRVLRQQIEHQVVRVEVRLAVRAADPLGLDHDALAPQGEFRVEAVKDVVAGHQLVDGVGVYRDAQRVLRVQVVRDIRLEQHEQRQLGPRVKAPGDPLKARHRAQLRLGQALAVPAVHMVLDGILPARLQHVQLQIAVGRVASDELRHEGAFPDDPALPAEREDAVRRDKVEEQPARRAGDAPAPVHRDIAQPRHHGAAAQGEGQLLIPVHQGPEAVLPADPVEEGLLLLTLDVHRDLLVHQAVGPVLAGLFGQACGDLMAGDMPKPVKYFIIVEAAYMSRVPFFP